MPSGLRMRTEQMPERTGSDGTAHRQRHPQALHNDWKATWCNQYQEGVTRPSVGSRRAATPVPRSTRAATWLAASSGWRSSGSASACSSTARLGLAPWDVFHQGVVQPHRPLARLGHRDRRLPAAAVVDPAASTSRRRHDPQRGRDRSRRQPHRRSPAIHRSADPATRLRRRRGRRDRGRLRPVHRRRARHRPPRRDHGRSRSAWLLRPRRRAPCSRRS